MTTPEERKLKKHLTDLVEAVRLYLATMDQIMREPSTPERGHKIAILSNALEIAKDSARFFGLDIDPRTGKKRRVSK